MVTLTLQQVTIAVANGAASASMACERKVGATSTASRRSLRRIELIFPGNLKGKVYATTHADSGHVYRAR